MFLQNLIVLLLILLALIFVAYFIIKGRLSAAEIVQEEEYNIDAMVEYVKNYFNSLIGIRSTGKKHLNEKDILKEKERRKLQRAVRSCSHGDIKSKMLVKNYIKKWLVEAKCSDPEKYNLILPFANSSYFSAADKFEILLYDYGREYGYGAASALLTDLLEIHNEQRHGRRNDDVKTEHPSYVIDSEDVEILYDERCFVPSEDEKADIITNFIYRKYKGHGVIDTLRDQDIDGISAGVSGIVTEDDVEIPAFTDEWGEVIPSSSEGLKNYESVWVFYHGNMIRLSFLSFGSQAELERVCKNIYRYNSPGQLSASKGFMANEMQDGSRVIVVRPPMAESWGFFIRKFGKKGKLSVDELITDPGGEQLKELLKNLIAGCQVFAITGEQGCGKTTMLKALIGFIPANLTLRIQELIFELHLRDEYPERNIVSFRETEDVSGRDALDLQKKTDGMVNIIGEVASAPVAGWLVMVSQVASRFTIFTHHAKTTESLISALRNDLMNSSGFNNETIAEMQVRQSIRFDVHMMRFADGSRRIVRVTEISRDREGGESCRLIMKYTRDGYIYCAPISKATEEEMALNMSEREKERFLDIQQQLRKGKEVENKQIA